jgi:hypothetical protein
VVHVDLVKLIDLLCLKEHTDDQPIGDVISEMILIHDLKSTCVKLEIMIKIKLKSSRLLLRIFFESEALIMKNATTTAIS